MDALRGLTVFGDGQYMAGDGIVIWSEMLFGYQRYFGLCKKLLLLWVLSFVWKVLH